MPLPAPKPLDGVLARINHFFDTFTRPGDIERHSLQKSLEDGLRARPLQANLGLAMLAVLDKNESLMKNYFKRAFQHGGQSASLFYNYGLALLWLGYPDEATQEFWKAARADTTGTHLDNLAYFSMILEDSDLCLEILQKANKLKINGENILLLAAYMGVANAGSPEEEAMIMESVFSEEHLRKNSLPASEAHIAEFHQLAKELEKYL